MWSGRTQQREPSRTVALDNGRAEDGRPLIDARLRWAFRTLITLHAVAVFAQSILAGAFLDGHYAMLALHRQNAIGLILLGYVQILVAIAYWRAGGGPSWPLWASVALSVAETVQFFLGLGRLIGLHVPLGVTIIVCTILLAQWAWGDRFGRLRQPALGTA